jgi:hypothetical protein
MVDSKLEKGKHATVRKPGQPLDGGSYRDRIATLPALKGSYTRCSIPSVHVEDVGRTDPDLA